MKTKLKDILRRIHIYWLRFKSKSVRYIQPKGKVLIVAPHPDDEVLGCGGLIARLVKGGNPPNVVILTGGEGSHHRCCDTPKKEIVETRRVLTKKALAILGVSNENIHELDYPDGNISMDDPQTNCLERLIEELKPQAVFVPHYGEGWSDHIKAGEIVKKIVPQGTQVFEYCVWMWYYNVWRALDWRNAFKLEMTHDEHSAKCHAVDEYVVPQAPCGNPWSGVLPGLLIKAAKCPREIYFRTTKE